jgi:hypothetical protein
LRYPGRAGISWSSGFLDLNDEQSLSLRPSPPRFPFTKHPYFIHIDDSILYSRTASLSACIRPPVYTLPISNRPPCCICPSSYCICISLRLILSLEFVHRSHHSFGPIASISFARNEITRCIHIKYNQKCLVSCVYLILNPEQGTVRSEHG